MENNRTRIAVLVSGSGTTLQNLIDVINRGDLRAKISIVIGSKPGLKALERAQAAGIVQMAVDRRSFGTVAEFSTEVFRLIDLAEVDLICMAGWLSLLEIPERYAGRVMNIHPALLPAFGGQGMYGKRVHQAVLDYGCKVSGCTVHFVDQAYDNGPIILQRVCPVQDNDTAETLAERVFEQEKIAYSAGISLYQQRRLAIEGRRVVVIPEI